MNRMWHIANLVLLLRTRALGEGGLYRHTTKPCRHNLQRHTPSKRARAGMAANAAPTIAPWTLSLANYAFAYHHLCRRLLGYWNQNSRVQDTCGQSRYIYHILNESDLHLVHTDQCFVAWTPWFQTLWRDWGLALERACACHLPWLTYVGRYCCEPTQTQWWCSRQRSHQSWVCTPLDRNRLLETPQNLREWWHHQVPTLRDKPHLFADTPGFFLHAAWAVAAQFPWNGPCPRLSHWVPTWGPCWVRITHRVHPTRFTLVIYDQRRACWKVARHQVGPRGTHRFQQILLDWAFYLNDLGVGLPHAVDAVDQVDGTNNKANANT